MNFGADFLQQWGGGYTHTQKKKKWRLWEDLIEMFPYTRRPAFALYPLSRKNSFEFSPTGWVIAITGGHS